MTISNKINFKTQLVAAIKHLRSMKMAEDYPDFNIGTISIITLAAFLLVIAAFTKIELPIIYISNPFDLSNYSNVI